jgi:hypothetical protein
MFNKLVMAFARAPARLADPKSAVLGGGSTALATRGGMALAGGGEPPLALDPEVPAVTVTLVERVRLRVNPVNLNGGQVPCGPFAWKWEEPIGKLVVSAHTTSAWFYPVACGICAVTVSGAKREAVILVNVVPAVPEVLGLTADAPEVFRDLAAVDSGAALVL